MLPGHASAGLVSCALGEIPLIDPRIEGPVQAMIRPEQIQIRASPGATARTSGGHRVTATAIARAFYGPDTVIQLQLDGVDVAISA